MRRRLPADVADYPEKHGDKELWARLCADDFAGPVYERVIDELVRHGWKVIRGWVRRGQLQAQCAEKGIRGLPSEAFLVGWTDDDLDDLIQDTLSAAAVKFRRDAMAGRGWRPDGGASMSSYFISGCLYAFVGAYRSHLAARNRHDRALAASKQSQPASVPDIAEAVAAQDAAMKLLANVRNPKLRRVLELAGEGHNYAEISSRLGDGTSVRAIEGMLYRHRRCQGGER